MGGGGGERSLFIFSASFDATPLAQACTSAVFQICNSPHHTDTDYRFGAIYRCMYAYTETLLDIYVCRCLKIHREALHSLHKGDQRKPSEVKEERSFSNSIITSETPHPPTSSLSPPLSSHKHQCWPGPGGPDGMLQMELVAVPRAALGFLALGLSPDKAVAPSQSWLNDITQQNEKKKKNTLLVVNKCCMTLQVYALLAFQIRSGDLVRRNVLPDGCKGILHNGYEKWILSSLGNLHPAVIFAQHRNRNTPPVTNQYFSESLHATRARCSRGNGFGEKQVNISSPALCCPLVCPWG